MQALSFQLSFQVVLGIGVALLCTLFGYRVIESVFYFIGYKFGESKAKEARLRALEEREVAGIAAANPKA